MNNLCTFTRCAIWSGKARVGQVFNYVISKLTHIWQNCPSSSLLSKQSLFRLTKTAVRDPKTFPLATAMQYICQVIGYFLLSNTKQTVAVPRFPRDGAMLKEGHQTTICESPVPPSPHLDPPMKKGDNLDFLPVYQHHEWLPSMLAKLRWKLCESVDTDNSWLLY